MEVQRAISPEGAKVPARPELLEATDADIDEALSYADPMALRGLLYQLTGEEALASIELTPQAGIDPAKFVSDSDVALVRAKGAEFLRVYRDAGAGPIDIGPRQRLPLSLALAAGVEQVPPQDLELWLEELALDPYARGLEWEVPPLPERLHSFSVVVIGAGMGGLNAAVLLKQAGIDFTVIEKNSGVGGTWFENVYPGSRVDSPSRAYSHIFGVDFGFSYPFCIRDENQRYFNQVADAFGVRDHIVFDTEVVSLHWDDDTSRWEVISKGPEGQSVWRPNVVISAVGLLSRPSLPRIEGISDFEGPSFHTAQWPGGLDLAGKRVGVIGTGCSGVQLVPELALLTGHVYVFQRSPEWLFDRQGYLAPYPPEVPWLDRNLPYHTNFMRFRTHWLMSPYLSGPLREVDPTFDDPHARSAVNKRMRDQRIAFIEKKFASRPDLIDKMIPSYPPYGRRPVQVDADYSYYDALLRDNVTLVTDGIERITPSGIRTSEGVEHELDVIVYATGFKANECLWPMEVRGRGGRSVEELWAKDGPRAYIGVMAPAFPNLFMIYGPNMNAYGGLGVINLEEMATRFALECTEHLIVNGKRAVEVTDEAYWRWNAELDEREKSRIYMDPRAKSYYQNEHGRSATNCPFPGTEMWHRLRRPNFRDLIVQ
ncbi:MAG TPA: NAD(P)/FAD-dependent oxidoreductase [Acidimicrobiales bacterium]|nr:NAD(P)/FAD-dependent oxidoreductase [Acidimicrobiales bacterium]